jgi:dihydropteroate synthase
MGVLNITPDSFSDGGAFLAVEAAVVQARRLVAAGARVLDVGAEASSFFRKGVGPVEAGVQLERLLPVVEALRRALPGVPLSIDTRSAVVAEACLVRGAGIVNDISAGTHDERMLGVVGRFGVAVVLMHIMPGYPKTAAEDADIVGRVRTYLAERVAAAEAAGISRERIAVDPGVGFGKSMGDNWVLVREVERVAPAGVAVVLGVSRKRFLETEPPGEMAERVRGFLPAGWAGEHPRDAMTAAVTAYVGTRARLHRVHAIPPLP